MGEILIRGAETVLTMDNAGTELAGADILLRDGAIVAVGTGLKTTGEVVLAQGCVVTPGLVNTHHHLYQNLSNEWGWPHLQVSSLYGFLQLLVNAAALLLWRAEVFAWPYVILIYLVLVGLYVVAKWQVVSRFPVKSY